MCPPSILLGDGMTMHRDICASLARRAGPYAYRLDPRRTGTAYKGAQSTTTDLKTMLFSLLVS